MSQPFLSSIMVVSFGFAPKGWALCNGQLLPINQNQALFALLGTTFGGDGRQTFALPNLQGRAAVGAGTPWTLGQTGGEANHTLTSAEMPQHSHPWQGNSTGGNAASPTGNTVAGNQIYTFPTNTVTMNTATITTVGGGQPHMNQSPYLVLNFCIALQGIFPSQN
jgi:microcystin-dependent protein